MGRCLTLAEQLDKISNLPEVLQRKKLLSKLLRVHLKKQLKKNHSRDKLRIVGKQMKMRRLHLFLALNPILHKIHKSNNPNHLKLQSLQSKRKWKNKSNRSKSKNKLKNQRKKKLLSQPKRHSPRKLKLRQNPLKNQHRSQLRKHQRKKERILESMKMRKMKKQKKTKMMKKKKRRRKLNRKEKEVKTTSTLLVGYIHHNLTINSKTI